MWKTLLIAGFIIIGSACLLSLALPAEAAIYEDIVQAVHTNYYAPAATTTVWYGQIFTASSTSFLSASLFLDSGGNGISTTSPSELYLCKGDPVAGQNSAYYINNCVMTAASFAVYPTYESIGGGNYFINFSLSQSVFTSVGEIYYFMVKPIIVSATNIWYSDSGVDNYSAGRMLGAATSSKVDFAFKIYSDGTIPNSGPDTVVLDKDTIFENELAYSFEHTTCLLDHPDTACSLKMYYSPPSVNVPTYFFYNLNDEPDADHGIIATSTPTDDWSYSTRITIPYLESTATSTKQLYCMIAIDSVNSATYENYQIPHHQLVSNNIKTFHDIRRYGVGRQKTDNKTGHARPNDNKDSCEHIIRLALRTSAGAA